MKAVMLLIDYEIQSKLHGRSELEMIKSIYILVSIQFSLALQFYFPWFDGKSQVTKISTPIQINDTSLDQWNGTKKLETNLSRAIELNASMNCNEDLLELFALSLEMASKTKKCICCHLIDPSPFLRQF